MKGYETTLAVLIFVGINVLGLGTAFLLAKELQAGDILSFEGAVLGAAGAVLGAIYIEDRKRRQQEAEELEPIREALKNLKEALSEGIGAKVMADLQFTSVERAHRVVSKIHGYYPPKSPPILLRWDHYFAKMTTLTKSVEFMRQHSIGGHQPAKVSDSLGHQHLGVVEEVDALIAAYNKVHRRTS